MRRVCSPALCLAWLICGCASLNNVAPGKLKAANCVVGVLKSLVTTNAADLYVARHYRESNPLVAFEYRDQAGRNRFSWFEITNNGPDDYAYVYLDKEVPTAALPNNVSEAMASQCHVELQISES